MGALLSKPSQMSYRTWELDSFSTLNYLEFVSDNRLTIYTTANKAVRILSSFNWISDRTRYSYDGFHKQRINSCFSYGEKISWYQALSLLSEYVIFNKVILHWSALEPKAFYDIYNFLSRISDSVSLPFSDYQSLNFLKNLNDQKNLNNLTLFKWSLKEAAPTLIIESLQDINKKSLAIPTSIKETELNPLSGGFNFINLNQKCTAIFIQTEQLTSSSEQSIYFGSHGFVNANKLNLVIPSLLPYERTNFFTGEAFLKGPYNAKAYHEVTTILIQLYSLAVGNWSYRTKASFFYKFIKARKIQKDILIDYSSSKLVYKNFSFSQFLHFSNLSPELLTSEIQTCLLK